MYELTETMKKIAEILFNELSAISASLIELNEEVGWIFGSLDELKKATTKQESDVG